MADKIETKVDVRTYDRMIAMLKWGALGAGLLTALVIWLIAA